MRREVLIAPDKFKGTLSAGGAARAIARGWRRARPGDKLVLLPMSDGGDGFGEVISSLLGASVKYVKTVDAAHRPHVAKWWWESGTKTAIIESANVIGLAMLAPEQFHPFGTDTFGLGAVINAARTNGAKRWLVGIGGSATNDGGFGMARALGWRFLNSRCRIIEKWSGLRELREICAPSNNGSCRNLVVAVDVQNPLLGAKGATRIYGPQKGLRAKDFALAESCLRQLGRIIPGQPGENFVSRPGAGAAGGLGFGFLAFLGATLKPGFEIFAQYAGLHKRIKLADIIISGEGAIEKSTLMGKGVGELARRSHALEIPCIGLAGTVDLPRPGKKAFSSLHALTDLTTLDQAKAKPAYWLERLAAKAAAEWGTA